ncbi:UNKNOWN [Stylonychia lemnae]|uniref:Uncharacterized protein n=1 Tax=Stylonychia lemnae TaxID=5949 RepID=A0A077ZUA6_STYLE|nr:UNKNOWN [Stylonychia lemnae]|eukprot:CDW73488.1 UNKNOWN [Stylonychia lemnae]
MLGMTQQIANAKFLKTNDSFTIVERGIKNSGKNDFRRQRQTQDSKLLIPTRRPRNYPILKQEEIIELKIQFKFDDDSNSEIDLNDFDKAGEIKQFDIFLSEKAMDKINICQKNRLFIKK